MEEPGAYSELEMVIPSDVGCISAALSARRLAKQVLRKRSSAGKMELV